MNIAEVAQCASRIRGETITGIYVGPSHVRFEFISQAATFVVVKKRFQFMVEGEQFQFDPQQRRADDSPAFVLLRGLTCTGVAVSETSLRIELSQGSLIAVTMTRDDFEPIELLGYAGGASGEMEFNYVF